MKYINIPRDLPSVHKLLKDENVEGLVKNYGVLLVTRSAQKILERTRRLLLEGETTSFEAVIKILKDEIGRTVQSSLEPVINLTGTVLHTNLGRATLPETAIKAITEIARGACNLEFDLDTGKRGDRFKHCETLLCQLTGAKSVLVVNNNAAAVLLTLNTLANRKEVPVSRGELIEIGGAFRMPEIMAKAGCKLIEIGTTNRTHSQDFEMAINSKTALLMKVHTSNFEVKGFTKSVSAEELSKIAQSHNLPLVTDLGSGSLIDLQKFQLPYEMTVTDALKVGADLVTFSGDKLLGGPQAGIIAGRKDLIEKIKKNPLARAMRPDKITLAALHAVLKLYSNPESLKQELPTLRWLTRDLVEIETMANSLVDIMQERCPGFTTTVVPVLSQIGSGSLPIDRLQSFALRIASDKQKKSNMGVNKLAKAFRNLPTPVIGRVAENALLFDLRCLIDQQNFEKNLESLKIS